MTEQKKCYLAMVRETERLDRENVLLTLYAPPIAAEAKAGQFVEIASNQFLNRPFGVALTDPAEGTFKIGIRTVGAGTEALSQLNIGQTVKVLGPFGFGFTYNKVRRAYVIGGGTGIYPLLFLLRTLRDKGIETFTGCGFRSLSHVLLKDDFLAASDQYLTACEIGGGDLTGTAVDTLQELFHRHGPAEGTMVYACGPLPMLVAVNAWCEQNGIAAECSFEARMGCGFGVCRGCAIPVKRDGAVDYDRCCVEGPVFRRETVAWEALV